MVTVMAGKKKGGDTDYGFTYRKITVKIPWGNGEAEVTIRELTYGEYMELLAQSNTTLDRGGLLTTQFRFDAFAIGLLEKVIVDAPFTVNAENIKRLPLSVASRIYEAALEVNPFLGAPQQ